MIFILVYLLGVRCAGFLQSICEDYNDKYYVAKHRAIRSILKHTLGCRQCPEYSSSDNIRNWFRFGANAISALPLTSPNSTSTASDSEPYSAEALSLQSCPYLFENLEHEGLASIVTGIKNVLDDVLDCRLKFVSSTIIFYSICMNQLKCKKLIKCHQTEPCLEKCTQVVTRLTYMGFYMYFMLSS